MSTDTSLADIRREVAVMAIEDLRLLADSLEMLIAAGAQHEDYGPFSRITTVLIADLTDHLCDLGLR